MTAMTSSSSTWGRPKLYGNRDVDRLQWFVCKNLELNTKSPSLVSALHEPASSGGASAAQEGIVGQGGGQKFGGLGAGPVG
jgi:hypothetical protein